MTTSLHICDCRACALRGDEILRLRMLLGTEANAAGWLAHNMHVEYCREFGEDRLMLSLAPAWMEAENDFIARTKRIRAAMERKHGKATVAPVLVPEPTEYIAPVIPLFGGRLAGE